MEIVRKAREKYGEVLKEDNISCPFCNEANPKTAVYCLSCGKKISDRTEEQKPKNLDPFLITTSEALTKQNNNSIHTTETYIYKKNASGDDLGDQLIRRQQKDSVEKWGKEDQKTPALGAQSDFRMNTVDYDSSNAMGQNFPTFTMQELQKLQELSNVSDQPAKSQEDTGFEVMNSQQPLTMTEPEADEALTSNFESDAEKMRWLEHLKRNEEMLNKIMANTEENNTKTRGKIWGKLGKAWRK